MVLNFSPLKIPHLEVEIMQVNTVIQGGVHFKKPNKRPLQWQQIIVYKKYGQPIPHILETDKYNTEQH
jgi:hypothetical protein